VERLLGPPTLLRSYGGHPSRAARKTRPAIRSRERSERLAKDGGEGGSLAIAFAVLCHRLPRSVNRFYLRRLGLRRSCHPYPRLATVCCWRRHDVTQNVTRRRTLRGCPRRSPGARSTRTTSLERSIRKDFLNLLCIELLPMMRKRTCRQQPVKCARCPHQ
jgi:hypothetical protein